MTFNVKNCTLLGLVFFSAHGCSASEPETSPIFEVEVVAEGLEKPWALQFLPNGDYLVSEHAGSLKRVTPGGELIQINGVPEIETSGQGGLLDIKLDDAHIDNQRLYFCFAAQGEDGYSTHLASARLVDNALLDVSPLFAASPKNNNGRHFGCRIEFDQDGHIFLSLGDLGERNLSQDQTNHAGSVIRLNLDGSVPRDNPFIGRELIEPEIFSYGHRNPQGMMRHPVSGLIWIHEHGPKGGDELNIIQSGKNYGWPVITYGVEYGSGNKIGEGFEKEGMEQPVYYWVPSIAPSGMTFYTGDAFPEWTNSLFIGSLKFKLLVRLQLDGTSIVSEERLLENEYGRIRDVRQGPNGSLYLLTDANNGKLIRLIPKPQDASFGHENTNITNEKDNEKNK